MQKITSSLYLGFATLTGPYWRTSAAQTSCVEFKESLNKLFVRELREVGMKREGQQRCKGGIWDWIGLSRV